MFYKNVFDTQASYTIHNACVLSYLRLWDTNDIFLKIKEMKKDLWLIISNYYLVWVHCYLLKRLGSYNLESDVTQFYKAPVSFPTRIDDCL